MTDPKIIALTPDSRSKPQRSHDATSAALALASGPAEVVSVRKYLEDPEGAATQSQSPQDEVFANLLNGNQIIEPPFDLFGLSVQPEQSSELGQVITAMEVNIDGFGHQIKPLVEKDKLSPEDRQAMEQERSDIDHFFEYCNVRDSFVELRRKTRVDRELTGNAYWEVIRDDQNRIRGFEQIQAYQVRLSPRESRAVRVEMPILKKRPDGTFQATSMVVYERFRKFAVSSAVAIRANFHSTLATSSGVRWFKEFGDTRIMDGETGEYVNPEDLLNWKNTGFPMPVERRAHELIHFSIFSPRTPYGVPRYIGNLLSIAGDRMAEETNYTTFQNNQIPSAFLLCSNGQVTASSINRIKEFMESQHQGKRNYAKLVIIEAEGSNEGDDPGQAKLELKPATQAQHKDALFLEYSKGNQDKIRRCFRLPPIFVGRADDYTRSTAESSRRLADEQVFAPERQAFDAFVNRRLFPSMGIRFHKFQSNSPNTTDNNEVVMMLANAEKTGGMTPRIARGAMEDVLGKELPPFKVTDKFDPDLPFSMAMAEAVKSKADPAEPGQTLTALKAFGILGGDHASDGENNAEDLETASMLLRLKARIDKAWNKINAGHDDEEL